MKVHKSCLIGLAAAICLLAFHGSATAVQVKNLTTDTVVFFDDFEGVSPASNAPYPDYTGDYDPDNGASPGDWVTGEAYAEYIQVTEYSSPGSAERNNYLRMQVYGTSMMDMYFSAAQNTPGDMIRFEFMANLPSEARETQWYLKDSLGNGVINLITNKKGYQLCNYHATGYAQVTGVTYTPDVWQHWAIDYAIGAATWTLTIDDVTSNPNLVASSGGLSNGYIRLATARWSYFDAVPGLILPGDANRDYIVDEADAAILAENWLLQGGATWRDGDFNGDFNVDDADATLMAGNWGRSTLEEPTSAPEPSVCMLLIFAGLAFSALIRRNVFTV